MKVPASVPAPAAALTLDEEWKRLLVSDRYADMGALCEGQLGELEAERSRVDADLAKRRKRLKAADALAEVEGDDGTD